jgi:hypothetical protein
MHKTSYLNLMMMNSTMPKYKSTPGGGVGQSTLERPVNMFEMFKRVQEGKGL